METDFFIVPAICLANTYFLFRDSGVEIQFTALNGKISIIGKGYFTPPELEWIKLNFL